MLRRSITLMSVALLSLSLTGFSSPLALAAEEQGKPWWLWIAVLFVLAAFVAFVLWYWMRSRDEEEEEEETAPHAKPEHAVAQDEVEEGRQEED